MTPLPILDYGDLLGQTLLFLAVCAGVVVAIRTWAHALTRENAAHLLRQRQQRRRKSDLYFCTICGTHCDFTHELWVATEYAEGVVLNMHNEPLCADCHTIAPHGASPERAK